MKTKVKYSYIIFLPTHNEELILKRSVRKLSNYINKKNYKDTAIVILDNNSTDKTPKIGAKCANEYSNVFYNRLEKSGRGLAIKEGIKSFPSKYYMYFDIDLPTNLKTIKAFRENLQNNDLVILKRIGKRPLLRTLMTKTYKLLCSLILEIDYSDIQSGAKAFNKNLAANIVMKSRFNDYLLDTDVVYKSNINGFQIKEVKGSWIDSRYPERDSKINILKYTKSGISGLLTIASETNKRISHSIFGASISTMIFLFLFVGMQFKFSLLKDIIEPPFVIFLPSAYWLLIALSLSYYLIYRTYTKSPVNRTFNIFLSTLGFALVVPFAILTIPIFSSDLYFVMILSKGFSDLGLNPYLTTPNDLRQFVDLHSLNYWLDLTMLHGPLTPLIYAIPAKIDNLRISIIIIKLFSASSLVISAYFFYKAIKMNERLAPQLHKILPLILLNPFLIITCIIDVHNDTFVMLTITIAYYFLQKKKIRFSVLALLCGVLLKYMAIIIIPALYVYEMKYSERSLIEKYRYLFITTILAIIITIGVYSAFFEGLETFDSLVLLARNKTSVGSPINARIYNTVNINSVYMKLAGMLITGGLAIYLSIKKRIPEMFLYPILIFLVVFANYLQSWYFTWIYLFIFIVFPFQVSFAFTITLIMIMFATPPYLGFSLLLIWLTYYMIRNKMFIPKTKL